MRSRADTAVGRGTSPSRAGWRRWLELALRLLALGLLALVLVRSFTPRDLTRPARAAGSDVRVALERWSGDPGVTSAHVSLERPPSAATRGWMRALRDAGVALRYDAPGWSPLALAVSPIADPAGPTRISVAAPAGARVVVSDAIGVLDTLSVQSGGGSLDIVAPSPPVTAEVEGVTAAQGGAEPLVIRPVMVIGQAGWEAKFTVAALEERGWKVVSRMIVAPGVEVMGGDMTPLDTARLAAVVALDSSASRSAEAIVRFVRSGGGLILEPAASRVPALRAIAAGGVGAALPPAQRELAGSAPRAGLPLQPITSLAADALALEQRGGAVAIAARREGLGRVVQLGYAESWRWRMEGAEGAPEAHRRWWSGLVAGVAYARPLAPPREGVDGGDGASGAERAVSGLDAAPVAGLIDAVGAPSPPPAGGIARGADTRMPWWALAAAMAALLAEWTSRRLRGVR